MPSTPDPSGDADTTPAPWERARHSRGAGAASVPPVLPGPVGTGPPVGTGAPAGSGNSTPAVGTSTPSTAGTAPETSGATDGDTADGTPSADGTASPEGSAGPEGTAAGKHARSAARRARRRRTKDSKKAPWWELPVLVVIAIAVAIVVKTFLIQPFYIPSASMETTLHGCPGCSGDRVIVNKPIYDIVRDPHPGDVVVFRAPPGWGDEVPATSAPSNPVTKGLRWFGQLVGVVPPDEEDLIKRVIAVGGQTVKCCDLAGNVQVGNDGPNGAFRSVADSSFVFEDPGSQEFGQLKFGPVTIPRGRLWVMGDHRNDSKDSRYYCGAPPGAQTTACSDGTVQTATAATVPTSLVIGKAVLIAWPPSRWTTLGTPKTFEHDPLPSSAARASLTALADVTTSGGPLLLGLVGAVGVGGVRRRRRVRRARPARPADATAEPDA